MATKVLVVEDDLEINELLGEYLSLENIAYVQAVTGKAGIHQAATEHPDAMILDLMLPDIDGFEVAKALSTKRVTFDVPIVVLSCMCQDCDRQRAFASGALFYMNKPFLPDDLLSTLRQALEWRRSLRERVPAGTIMLGSPDEDLSCAQGIHQMVADIFVRTDLSDAAVTRIREAIDMLAQWAAQWNTEHRGNVRVRLDYAIKAGEGDGTHPALEWALSESAPGMLAEGFFRPATAGPSAGLAGWGAGLMGKAAVPIMPPAKWLQVLAKTGAARFEKDVRERTVRFIRFGEGVDLSVAQVPVVEVGNDRAATGARGEMIATQKS